MAYNDIVNDYLAQFNGVEEITKQMIDASIDVELTERVMKMADAASKISEAYNAHIEGLNSQLAEVTGKYTRAQEVANEVFLKYHDRETPPAPEAPNQDPFTLLCNAAKNTGGKR